MSINGYLINIDGATSLGKGLTSFNLYSIAIYLTFGHVNVCSLNQAIASASVDSAAGNIHCASCNYISCVHCATSQGHLLASFHRGCLDNTAIDQQFRGGYLGSIGSNVAIIHGHVLNCIHVHTTSSCTNCTIVYCHSVVCCHANIASCCTYRAIVHGHSIIGS